MSVFQPFEVFIMIIQSFLLKERLTFTKQCISSDHAVHEAQHLQLVQGQGVVPLQGISESELLLSEAACSLADVAHHRGKLPETEVRAVGAAAATALARVHEAGLVHGDVKPANLLLSHGGELWLADFDASVVADGRPLLRYSPSRTGPDALARFDTDIAALVVTLVELATGFLIDPVTSWGIGDLRRLGCSTALSTELSLILQSSAASDVSDDCAQDARNAAAMLTKGGGLLPAPVCRVHSADSTPTVEFTLAQPVVSAASQTPTPTPPRAWQRYLTGLATALRPGQVSNISQASRSS